jgi:hypothetical protein
MCLTHHDEVLAKEDVVEYLRNSEDAGSINYNLKLAATEIWSSFMEMGSSYDPKTKVYHPGPHFQENLEFIIAKMGSSNLIDKELGMYIFWKNQVAIIRVDSVKKVVPAILEKYLVGELGSPVLLMRARANDVIE